MWTAARQRVAHFHNCRQRWWHSLRSSCGPTLTDTGSKHAHRARGDAPVACTTVRKLVPRARGPLCYAGSVHGSVHKR